MFTDTVKNYWHDEFRGDSIVFSDVHFSIATTSDPEDESDSAILELLNKTQVVLSDTLAKQVLSETVVTIAEFHQRLEGAGLQCHGADYLFYFSEAELKRISTLDVPSDIRILTEEDSLLFKAFCDKASEADLDAAYVELDHWLVAGVFENGELVSVASMYSWDDSKLADTGVLTLPSGRGKGHAHRLFLAISRFAIERGFEPQYRCQLDNIPSIALANACGLVEFGKWNLIIQP